MKNQNQHAHNGHKKQPSPALALALLLALTGLLAGTANAQPQVVLKLSPSTTRISHGETVDVALQVEGAHNLHGAQAKVHFDPARLAVQDADPTAEGIQVVLGSFLSPDFVVVNKADNEAGTLRLAFTQMTPRPPAEGSGDLATITFEGIGNGAADLTWSDVILSNGDGQGIDTHLEGAEIQVEGELSTSILLAGGVGIAGIALVLLAGWMRVIRRRSA
jgi:hypothetical protein